MFEHKHYVPILKGRDGEYGALSSVPPPLKARMTPLIELPPIPWDFEAETPARTIDIHLKKVAQKIERAWGRDRAFFLDLLWIAESERMDDGTHPLSFVCNSARNRRLSPIPVVSLIRGEEYLEACAASVATDRRGVCVRLQREDFVDFADIEPQLKRVLTAVNTQEADADLLLDFRALTPDSRSLNTRDALTLISRIPELNAWRSFTVAGTSFPENLIGLPPSDFSFIPRSEWRLWRSILRERPGRLPSFADYAVSHPEPSEVDPRIMRPSASVRYTTDEYWLVPKGRNLRDYGYEQFHAVCRELIARPEYAGRSLSWGDGYIDDCANEIVGTGNLTTWRKVATSHHFAYVLRQLSIAFDS
jgi:hypothetical protein